MSAAPVILGQGFIVALRTEVSGGCTNLRFPLDEKPEGEHGQLRRWRTEQHISHVEALKAAGKVRSDARNVVVKACKKTIVALWLPVADEEKFETSLAAANAMIAAHNAAAAEAGTPVRVSLVALRGRIGGESSRAAELASIKACASDLLAQLGAAVAAGDVKTLRDLATQARSLGPMLEDGSEGRTKLDRAVKQARAVAKAIVSRVVEQGELLADVLASAQTSAIAEARFAFEVVSIDDDPEPDAADADAVIALSGIEGPAVDLPALAEAQAMLGAITATIGGPIAFAPGDPLPNGEPDDDANLFDDEGDGDPAEDEHDHDADAWMTEGDEGGGD